MLTIAGSDSGGGAGIQADLKTFAAIGVHGASAITCITAQNPLEVRDVIEVRPETVRNQIEAVTEVLKPQAIKTGMLYSRAIIEVVQQTVQKNVPMIVDPVMISTSGALLLRESAVEALKQLMKKALLVTPNLHEAEHLLGRRIREPQELRAAAREFHELYGCAALIKGGHLPQMRVALDFLYDGKSEWMLEAPFVRGVSTHGTGCTYSAAITAYCALGDALPRAVYRAKEFISNAIARSYKSGGHFVLNTHWARR
ncbi:MAG: bifunctional hydroxymethylpyrimidine kinase/phosphomethylpyrimidine kinase [Limisphaerales bacterium]